jgi:putative selenate reductase
MAELIPFPFGKLVTRMFRELDKKRAIFDLPEKKFFLGSPAHDLSVTFHGRRASTPLGPAAGPHSQLAQNIVLAWLGGSRIMELKTVQVMDELKIPRPCIDMHNVGYNVEWSQELKLRQSLEEYVKASMLVEMLAKSGALKLAPGFTDVIYDMSVGYDLKGIQSEPVQAFMRGMRDAKDVVDRLRKEIPDEFKRFRDLDYKTELSGSLTLSTFHGCPPDEIEGIIRYLLTEMGLDCVIKFNPTLLGPKELRRLLQDVMGYRELHTPDTSFEKDTHWQQAVDMVGRLRETAKARGRSLGAKFSNTLIVENHRKFFTPDNKEMYMSGPPLHVLAMNLVQRFRKVFAAEIPVSFAAGIDRFNVADAVSLGLTPITICSDLLKTGGYARQETYFRELLKRMDAVGAKSIDEFVLKAHGQAASGDPKKAALLNTDVMVPRITGDARYAKSENSRDPQKVGTKLELFNCVTCDKCVQVCPNDANFAYALPPAEVPVVKWRWQAGAWKREDAGKLVFDKKHQIGNFADFCNECGNCDVYCPEDGGPYILKPRFFGSFESWKALAATHDGMYLERKDGRETVYGRFQGREYVLSVSKGGDASLAHGGLEVAFPVDRPEPGRLVKGTPAEGAELDFTYFHILDRFRKVLLSDAEVNYLNV